MMLTGVMTCFSLLPVVGQSPAEEMHLLQKRILTDPDMKRVEQMARKIASEGFNAGDGYGEVWIRDYNTFIELAMQVMPDEAIRSNLNTFFHFLGKSGDIVDGFIPKEKVWGGYLWKRQRRAWCSLPSDNPIRPITAGDFMHPKEKSITTLKATCIRQPTR